MAMKFYGSVSVRVHFPIDLHGAEPTVANLSDAARAQVSMVCRGLADGHPEGRRGLSFGPPEVCGIDIQFGEPGEGS